MEEKIRQKDKEEKNRYKGLFNPPPATAMTVSPVGAPAVTVTEIWPCELGFDALANFLKCPLFLRVERQLVLEQEGFQLFGETSVKLSGVTFIHTPKPNSTPPLPLTLRLSY